MIRFLCKRLLWMILTLWIVFTISFGLMQIVPGGPFDNERQLAPEVKRNIEAKYHLDDDWYVQYWSLLCDYVQLDFRNSFKLSDYSVGEVIAAGRQEHAAGGCLLPADAPYALVVRGVGLEGGGGGGAAEQLAAGWPTYTTGPAASPKLSGA